MTESTLPAWLLIYGATCIAFWQWLAMGAVLALMFGWDPWK